MALRLAPRRNAKDAEFQRIKGTGRYRLVQETQTHGRHRDARAYIQLLAKQVDPPLSGNCQGRSKQKNDTAKLLFDSVAYCSMSAPQKRDKAGTQGDIALLLDLALCPIPYLHVLPHIFQAKMNENPGKESETKNGTPNSLATHTDAQLPQKNLMGTARERAGMKDFENYIRFPFFFSKIDEFVNIDFLNYHGKSCYIKFNSNPIQVKMRQTSRFFA